ncbi:hypothetical protein Dimus_002610, partial [Dionaea muscipula]
FGQISGQVVPGRSPGRWFRVDLRADGSGQMGPGKWFRTDLRAGGSGKTSEQMGPGRPPGRWVRADLRADGSEKTSGQGLEYFKTLLAYSGLV